MNQYTNIAELQSEVSDRIFIDLTPHVLRLPAELLFALREPIPGVYLPSCYDPLFRTDSRYFISSPVKSRSVRIEVEDVIADLKRKATLPPGHFYSFEHKFILDRMKYQRLRPAFTLAPTLNVAAYEAAIAVVLDYLNHLNPNTHVSLQHYQLENLVREECYDLITRERFHIAFSNLETQVRGFVGKQTWCFYYYKVLGSTLLIERGIDYRIMQFELKALERREGFDHTYGEVVDAFALERGR
jgi:hypothetical protein